MQRISLSRFGRTRAPHFAAVLGLILGCTAAQQAPEPSVPAATGAPGGAQLAPAGSSPGTAPGSAPGVLERAAMDTSEPGWGIVEPAEAPPTYAEVVRR